MNKIRLWLTTAATAIALAAGATASASLPAAAHPSALRHSTLNVRVAVGVDAELHRPKRACVAYGSGTRRIPGPR